MKKTNMDNISKDTLFFNSEQSRIIGRLKTMEDDGIFRSELLKVLEKISENLGKISRNEYADSLNNKDIADENSFLK